MYNYSYGYDEVYCYPNSNVLRNKFNIKNMCELQELERGITSIREVQLLNDYDGVLNFKALKSIHKCLFSDIYTWAGEVRTVDIEKGTLFCRVFAINNEAERIFSELKDENYLRDCPVDVLHKRMSYYMSEINALHPFREGNGRTQRLFMAILAKRLGYGLHFELTSSREMIEASYNSFLKDYCMMDDIFYKILKKLD